jgi:hypothetical protein
MAIASLVLGITSIPTIATIIGPICAIIGFVLGICGSRAKDKKHGCATAGIVLSAVTLAIWLVIVLVLIFAASYTAGQTL